jgi:hypothetical protein
MDKLGQIKQDTQAVVPSCRNNYSLTYLLISKKYFAIKSIKALFSSDAYFTTFIPISLVLIYLSKSLLFFSKVVST